MRALFIISLIANVLLAACLGWVRSLPGGSGDPAAGRGLGGTQPHAQVPEVRTVVIRGRPIAFAWSMIDAPDERRLVANLRAIGCPEETVRDIITAAVSRRYFERHRQELEKPFRDFRYWENDYGLLTALTLESRERLRQERDQVVTVLLAGGPAAGSRGAAVVDEADWTWVAPERRDAANAIRRKYDLLDLQLQVRAASDYWGLALEEEELKLHAALRNELALLLSAQELEELEFRDSPTAQRVRRSGDATRSEAEFRAQVAQLRRAGAGLGSEFEAAEPTLVAASPPPPPLPPTLTPPAPAPQPTATAPTETTEGDVDTAPEDPLERLIELARQTGIDSRRAALAYERAAQLVDRYQTTVGDGSRLAPGQQAAMQRALRFQVEVVFFETMGPKGTNLVQAFLNNRL